jgi:hypothetical protein
MSEANLELRPGVGHNGGVEPVMNDPSASALLRDQTHTADASSGRPATKASVTMSDAGSASPRDEASAATDNKAGETTADLKSEEAAKPEAEPAAAKPGETASSEDKPGEAKSAETATAEIKSATAASDTHAAKANETQAATPASGDVAKAETPATGQVTAEIKADYKKPEAKAVTEIAPSAPAKKDPTRLLDGEQPAAAKPDPAAQAAPKRSGQISVFVSRKDSKLYVRQNFAPLFEVPITIAPSDRPLGTHVFTAQVDKDDANVLHWSVVSLPVPARYAARHDDDERVSRRRKIAGAVEMKPIPLPDSPAEALDRLTIPADAMARIAEALTTGASIIVSDQGIAAGETGEGTDFIVSLR